MKNSVYRCFIAVCCFAVMALVLAGCGTVTPQQPQIPTKKILPPAVEIQTIEQIKFAPTATHQKLAEVKDSFEIYNSTKGRATGVYEYQKLVYVIVNVDYGKEKINRRLTKATAMLRAKKMLQNTYKLPSKFNLRTHQLEARDIYQQKIYRYAIVFRKSDINAMLDSGKMLRPEAAVMSKTAVTAEQAKLAIKNNNEQNNNLKKEYKLQNNKSIQKTQIHEINKKKSSISAKRSVPAVKRKSTPFTQGAFCGDKNVEDDF